MSDYFILFLVIVVLIAALLREDYVLTLFYFVIGSYAISRWWSERAFKALTVQRTFNDRAFLYDKVTVRLDIANTSNLPVVWLRLHDSLPVELVGAENFRRVVSIGPRGHQQFQYDLQPGRRGYYQIGPLFLYSGDVLGLSEERARQGALDHLTVYPRIIPLSRVALPSRSPMGTLRHHQPIFEDPTRVRGKRDYVAGDSLRRVDWKATATSGRLQVKQFEPSIALETAIFLNLNTSDYYYRTRNDATELAIVVAASIANWVISKKQTAGLVTNGTDVLASNGHAPALAPEKGRGHLMRILDVLARVQMTETDSFVELLQRQRVNLAWGTTVILITGNADHAMFDELFQARRSGLNIVLVLCGHVIDAQEIKHRAEHFGIPVHHFNSEKDLDIWRK
ncbi:MAG: DUF58 domain-containing protein [Chloroflexi bacterium]|nr:DUF58 domain-containing protein [Chloroflexota bacterium]